MRGRVQTVLLSALVFSIVCLPGVAQSLLTVDSEQVLLNSTYGQSVLAAEAEQIDTLRARGRAVDSQFETEELRLTEERAKMDPEEFRELADEFDARVIATRAELRRQSRELEQANQARRVAFFNEVTPILLEILEETGATAIVEHRSILVARQDLNITEEVIKRLDQAYLAARERGTDNQAPQESEQENPRQE